MRKIFATALIFSSLKGLCQQLSMNQKSESLVRLFGEKLSRHDLNGLGSLFSDCANEASSQEYMKGKKYEMKNCSLFEFSSGKIIRFASILTRFHS